MSKIEKLKLEIEKLPKEEFIELVGWLSEKVDFLVREALDAKAKGNLTDL
jgi:hypothetical protein